jgi:GT2 family glycosyltransferase
MGRGLRAAPMVLTVVVASHTILAEDSAAMRRCGASAASPSTPAERAAATTVLPSSLQISIVTHRPDMKLLERCLRKLALAIGAGREAGAMRTVHLALIDNSEDSDIADSVTKLGKARFSDSGVHVTYLRGHANIGYGAAHNLVLHGTGSDYHLVLNPDVELAPDALANGVRWLDAHPEVGALAPMVQGSEGRREYLCKRYPSVFDLFLRGFAPSFVQRMFQRRLHRYEMRDLIDVEPPRELIGIPALSGAFMLVRRSAIDKTGGFDPRFFLYFEDFDWSVRLNRITKTAFVPSVQIGHHGGGAARKGGRHIHWFVKSGFRFYRLHGWKWF